MLRLVKNLFWRIVPHACKWYGTGTYQMWGSYRGAERCRCCYCGRWSH